MYDIIVAGGGVAGVSAAVAAARLGADVVLVERYGFLGGCTTAGLVNPFMTHETLDGKTKLVAGLFDEIKDRLKAYDGIMVNCFDPEVMKIVLLDMVLEANVTVKFHSLINETKDEKVYYEMEIINKSGKEILQAKRIIDTSGDGDVAYSLGADYEQGNKNGKPQAVTLMFDMAGVDLDKTLEYAKENPEEFLFPKWDANTDLEEIKTKAWSLAGFYSIIKDKKKDYKFPGDLLFFISRPENGIVTFNQTHSSVNSAVNIDDIIKAEIECRYQMIEIVHFVKNNIPGFENAYLLRSADHIGIRESRRIMGDYVFSEEDVSYSKKHEDCICRLAYPVDVHASTGEGYSKEEATKSVPIPARDDWYEIPFRSLKISKIKNLLVAGKCISATQGGHGAIRIIPACIATGQAAGTAFGICVRDSIKLENLDTNLLLKELRKNNALV